MTLVLHDLAGLPYNIRNLWMRSRNYITDICQQDCDMFTFANLIRANIQHLCWAFYKLRVCDVVLPAFQNFTTHA